LTEPDDELGIEKLEMGNARSGEREGWTLS
jgi:hypothetical protein